MKTQSLARFRIRHGYLSSCPRMVLVASYATHRSLGSRAGSPRKHVTVVNDDGRVSWEDLSAREKFARSTQQTFNTAIVAAGFILTGIVSYYLYDQVFSRNSRTSVFNRCVDEVKANGRAMELLGPANQVRAFGEPTWNKWARARPISSTVTKSVSGTEDLRMRFHMEGPRGHGTVNVHMIREPTTPNFEYRLLSLDVPGTSTVFIHKSQVDIKTKEKSLKFLGVQWR